MSWESIPGWTDESLHEVYRRAVRDASPTHRSTFVEVGVAFGRSAALMATLIYGSGKPITFFGVDAWLVEHWTDPELDEMQRAAGGFYEACCKFLDAELSPEERARVKLVRADSAVAAARFSGGDVDFCFIDSWHDEDAVRRDLDAWLPKMRRERVIAGHDYTGAWPGVERAVRARFGQPGVGYQVEGACWVVRT